MKTVSASKMFYLLQDWKYCISISEISASEEPKNFANLYIYRNLFRPNFIRLDYAWWRSVNLSAASMKHYVWGSY